MERTISDSAARAVLGITQDVIECLVADGYLVRAGKHISADSVDEYIRRIDETEEGE